MTGNGTNYLRRVWTCVKNSKGLINTTDLIVAAGATIILASGVASVALTGIDQAKLGKAQPDAQAIAQGMSQFFQDTGKWPGQADLAIDANKVATPKFLTTDTLGAIPDFGPLAFTAGEVTCSGNSLQGYATGVTVSAVTTSPTSLSDMLDINDFLVRKPDATKYPNWRGPYLQGEIKADPFGRVWVINTTPLFCAESVGLVDGTDLGSSGKLGYAWILTGGANRTVTTKLTSARLDDEGDDAGVNVGKLTTKKQQN